MKRLRIFILNAVILTVTSLFMSTIGISFQVYISNKIGAEAMGVFQLVMSIYTFGVTLAISGIGLASTRLVAEEMACGNEGGVKKAMIGCLMHALFFGCLSALLLYFSAPYIAENWLKNPLTLKPLYILSISFPFMALSSAINGYFTAMRRVIKNAATQIFEQFVRISLCIWFLGILMPKGIEGACTAVVLGGALAEVSSFVFLFVLYIFDKSRLKGRGAGGKIVSRMVKISLPIAASSYIRSGLSTIKHLLIPLRLQGSGLSTKAAVTQYGLVHGMTLPVILFPAAFLNSFSALLVPEIAAYYVKNQIDKINQITRRIFKGCMLFSVCVSGIFIFFADKLSMAIYGNYEVGVYLRLLAPVIIVMYLDNIVDGLLKGLNQQVKVVNINIIDTAVTIVLIYTVLPIYGILGYVFTIYASELLNGYLSLTRLFKTTGFKVRLMSWLGLPAAAFFVSVLISRLFMNFGLVFQLGVTIFLYFLCLYALGLVGKRDFCRMS